MSNKHSLRNLFLMVAMFSMVLAACGGAAATEAPAAEEPAAEEEVVEECDGLQEITFQAGFLPQGNISFAAAYVANEQGYFEEVCLDVTIEFASPGSGEQWQRLVGKDTEFTTSPAESFVNRINGTPDLPFKAVTLFGHEGDHGLLVLSDRGIESISDLAGLKIGFKGSDFAPPWLLAMLDAEGLTFDDVELIQVGFDPRVVLEEFGEGRVDGVQVFKSNEPDTLQRAGYEVTVFKPEDFDVHFLGQVYITHTDYIRDDPDMVRAFVRATMRGMQFILDSANKDTVTDNIMVYAGDDADRDHNEFIWTTEVQYVQSASTDEVGVGYASDQQWEDMMDFMIAFGSLEAQLDISAVWDSQFVESIYENGELIWP